MLAYGLALQFLYRRRPRAADDDHHQSVCTVPAIHDLYRQPSAAGYRARRGPAGGRRRGDRCLCRPSPGFEPARRCKLPDDDVAAPRQMVPAQRTYSRPLRPSDPARRRRASSSGDRADAFGEGRRLCRAERVDSRRLDDRHRSEGRDLSQHRRLPEVERQPGLSVRPGFGAGHTATIRSITFGPIEATVRPTSRTSPRSSFRKTPSPRTRSGRQPRSRSWPA